MRPTERLTAKTKKSFLFVAKEEETRAKKGGKSVHRDAAPHKLQIQIAAREFAHNSAPLMQAPQIYTYTSSQSQTSRHDYKEQHNEDDNEASDGADLGARANERKRRQRRRDAGAEKGGKKRRDGCNTNTGWKSLKLTAISLRCESLSTLLTRLFASSKPCAMLRVAARGGRGGGGRKRKQGSGCVLGIPRLRAETKQQKVTHQPQPLTTTLLCTTSNYFDLTPSHLLCIINFILKVLQYHVLLFKLACNRARNFFLP